MKEIKFVCPLTSINMEAACRLKACVWHSVSDASGCMARQCIPEPEDLSDAGVARHKGMTTEEVVRLRNLGILRITKTTTIHAYLDWATKFPAPFGLKNSDPDLAIAVNTLCEGYWIFQVPELNWTPLKVARCLHRPTLTKFNAHVGKKIDWLELLEIKKDTAQKLVDLFRSKSFTKEIK